MELTGQGQGKEKELGQAKIQELVADCNLRGNKLIIIHLRMKIISSTQLETRKVR